jgi:alcohol dehydrogenase
MKAIVFDGTLKVSDVPPPVALGREALIRVLLAGICNTDLEITRGYHQFHGILGHEFVGIVEKAADPRWPGRRVVGEINCACHQCDLCRRGLEKHCRTRSVLGIVNRPGALAEFCTLPMENLHEVPEEISNEEAVFVEPLAAALEILEQIDIRPEDRVCVMGDGKLAQLIVQVLAHQGKALMVIGKHQAKLDRMVECGAEVLLLEAMKQDASALAGTFDLVVEATGSPGGFQTALTLVRPRGTLLLKSTYHDRLVLDAAPLVVNEIRVVGSRCGPFPTALRKLRRQEVDVRSLVSDRYPLVQGRAAFERAQESGSLKILVNMGTVD